MAFNLSEAARDDMQHCREVYDTPEGRKEIENKMINSNFFGTIDPEDYVSIVKRNEMVTLLYRLGIFIDSNIPKIVDSLMDIEYMIKEE